MMKRSNVVVYGVILMLLVIGLQGCAGNGRFFWIRQQRPGHLNFLRLSRE